MKVIDGSIPDGQYTLEVTRNFKWHKVKWQNNSAQTFRLNLSRRRPYLKHFTT